VKKWGQELRVDTSRVLSELVEAVRRQSERPPLEAPSGELTSVKVSAGFEEHSQGGERISQGKIDGGGEPGVAGISGVFRQEQTSEGT